MANDPLTDFTVEPFTDGGTTHPVYWRGEGPGVLVITEVPGITPYVADFARRVVDEGFTVAMPDLFGVAGQEASPPYQAATIARACISREFKLFAEHQSSPVTQWLRPLGRELHARAGGPGIGAIGMCLTGNFALALAVDDHLLAPILSQPSLPFGATPQLRRALHLSADDLDTVKGRVQRDGLEIVAMRFAGDPLCPRARFDRLEQEFGNGLIRIELPDDARNPRGRPMPPHSVVTTDLVDEPGEATRDALDTVLDLFRRKLQTA